MPPCTRMRYASETRRRAIACCNRHRADRRGRRRILDKARTGNGQCRAFDALIAYSRVAAGSAPPDASAQRRLLRSSVKIFTVAQRQDQRRVRAVQHEAGASGGCRARGIAALRRTGRLRRQHREPVPSGAFRSILLEPSSGSSARPARRPGSARPDRSPPRTRQPQPARCEGGR